MPKKQVIDDFYSSLGIAKVKTKDKEHLKNETLYNLCQKPKKEKGENMPHFENNKADQVQQADILYLPDDNGHKNVGYTKERLQLVNDNEGQAPETLIKKFIPEKLLDKRKEKNKIQYLVKWKGYEKPDWNYLSDLKNKDNKNYIDDLINQYNKK